MFSTDFIFRQQENLVDNQKSQAGYRPLRNKILIFYLPCRIVWDVCKRKTDVVENLHDI